MNKKLIIVLLGAVLILLLGLSAALLTSCGVQATISVPVTPTVQDCICDGTISHPYSVNAFPGTPEDVWNVTTVRGPEIWYLNWIIAAGLQTVKPGDYITYYPHSAWSDTAQTYQVSSIDVKQKLLDTLPQDGHEMHPWRLQDHDGSQATIWHMASGDDATPRNQWPVVAWTITDNAVMSHIHPASFVLYGNAEYQIIRLDGVRHFIYAYQQ